MKLNHIIGATEECLLLRQMRYCSVINQQTRSLYMQVTCRRSCVVLKLPGLENGLSDS